MYTYHIGHIVDIQLHKPMQCKQRCTGYTHISTEDTIVSAGRSRPFLDGHQVGLKELHLGHTRKAEYVAVLPPEMGYTGIQVSQMQTKAHGPFRCGEKV